jgi:demethoxyubiquinone hydroxylase (CLK1/Coq7/Cat5 family)
MTQDSLSDNDRWLLNYYRASEINGALFFGRITRVVRGPLQVDVTHHFADEAAHANYWTECLSDLGYNPSRQIPAYQDQYFEAAGIPASLMEVLAITLVFEKRAISLYSSHLRSAPHPRVRQTLERIMLDERWHVKYVRDALQELSVRYGEELVTETLDRYAAADQEVYAKTIAEHGERMLFRAPSLSWDAVDSRGPRFEKEQF